MRMLGGGLLGLLGLGACGGSEERTAAVTEVQDDRPDVLLVTIDTLRADRVGAYGDPLAKTPQLDALAAEGLLVREAHAVTPLTLPSHASMLTGLLPARHGLRDNGGFRLAEETTTLAETLQSGGYATAAFVSAYVLDGAWGLDQGFDLYRDPFHPQELNQVGAFGEVELPSAEVINAAVAWWRSHGRETPGQPRFAWVHLYDPHTPWAAHAGWEGDPYRGEVAYVDGLLERLLDEVGKDALVIVTSDHGEGLWAHGEREHGLLLSRDATRVPLILRPPGGLSGAMAPEPRPGQAAFARPDGVDAALELSPVPDAPRAARVVQGPASGVDIAPTIAHYAKVKLPDTDGLSLHPLLETDRLERRAVLAETWFPRFHFGLSALVMAQDGSHRLERGARDHAYAWTTDPDGQTAVSAPAALVEALAGVDLSAAPTPGPIDADTRQALEALGYLTTTVDAPEQPADPRDALPVLSKLQAAEVIEEPTERVDALRALVAAHPDMVDARISLSLALVAAGDAEQARTETEAVLERWPDHPTALANAAALALEAGDLEATLEHATHMRALNPRDGRSYRLELAVRAAQEEPGEMIHVGLAGLEVAPDDPNLHYLVALAQTQSGQAAEAIPHLEAARKHGSLAKDIDLWLGVAHERAGHIDEAKAAYELATRADPRDLRPWAMAGWMLYKADRCPEAWPFLVNVARRGGSADPKVKEAVAACADKRKAPAP
jgi:arylsulfatase A-like enzyme/tetratricopeptide (TPR) repeat protein